MKRSIILVMAILAVLSYSCKKVEYHDSNVIPQIKGTPLDDGKISIKATVGGINSKSLTIYKSTNANDTILDEKWLKTNYQAIASPAVNIVSWQWTFNENNQKVTGASVDFWHSLDPGSKTSVTLIGIEASGTAHTTTIWVKIVNSLDGLPGMYVVTRTPVAGGLCSYVIICHKKSMSGVSGVYGYTGTISTPTWSILPIPPADTNFNYVNGLLVAAAAGDVGKYVAIRFITYPGDYEFHIGHIAKDGTLVWGNPWDWFVGGKYTQAANNDLLARAVATLPGKSGDEGVNAVIRQDIGDSTVTVYTKQTAAFTKGFIQTQNANGTWNTAIAQTAVTNFPNWGKIVVKYKDFPIKDLFVFRFGADITAPMIFSNMSSNMPLSSYWSPIDQCLRAKYAPVGK